MSNHVLPVRFPYGRLHNGAITQHKSQICALLDHTQTAIQTVKIIYPVTPFVDDDQLISYLQSHFTYILETVGKRLASCDSLLYICGPTRSVHSSYLSLARRPRPSSLRPCLMKASNGGGEAREADQCTLIDQFHLLGSAISMQKRAFRVQKISRKKQKKTKSSKRYDSFF